MYLIRLLCNSFLRLFKLVLCCSLCTKSSQVAKPLVPSSSNSTKAFLVCTWACCACHSASLRVWPTLQTLTGKCRLSGRHPRAGEGLLLQRFCPSGGRCGSRAGGHFEARVLICLLRACENPSGAGTGEGRPQSWYKTSCTKSSCI